MFYTTSCWCSDPRVWFCFFVFRLYKVPSHHIAVVGFLAFSNVACQLQGSRGHQGGPPEGLQMKDNHLRPGPHWGSLQRSPDPLVGGEGELLPFPKNPTPAVGLRALLSHPNVSRHPQFHFSKNMHELNCAWQICCFSLLVVHCCNIVN